MSDLATPAAPHLMPDYDPQWFTRMEVANARRMELMSKPGALSDEERRDLAAAQREMEAAHMAQFETVADYRDHKFAFARQLLDDEGICMELPDLPDDCTRDQVDHVLMLVADAVEVTNGETF